MKGSNSRFSYRPELRYSNSAHVQGGMVTDADLTEAGLLHQSRDEAQGAVTVQSGTPVTNGAVVINNGLPALAEGWIVAQGKQGVLRAASGTPPVNGLGLFADQADLPLGPALGNARALLYADLWERPVFALQDPYLADPGLHGAETTYRIRTMTQLKSLPLSAPDALEKAQAMLRAGEGAFTRIGTALATVTPKNTEIAVDDCDPCADQINVEQTLPNALFRLEIIAVERNTAGTPLAVQLAWSMENAAAMESTQALADASARATFERKKAVYEFFSEATEAQVGIFPGTHIPERPVLSATLFPVAEPAAGANAGAPYSHVRRWDGAATLELENDAVESPLGTGKMTLAAGKATLTVDAFSLDLAVKGQALLAGDYWLVELRRYAPEAERIRLVGSPDNSNAPPAGTGHHFCPLFVIDGGAPVALEDADKRRLSFPPLSAIPATHVGFDPQCPDFYDNADNVAQALNALCDLDASQVAYTPSADCERFEGVKTVEEAFEKLCKVQDETAVTRVLRLMMDWGVVCGINVTLPKRFDTVIKWTGGTLLDRSGRLIDVKAGEFDLATLPADNIHGTLQEILEKEGEICISFAADRDDRLSIHLSNRRTAFGPSDRTFKEAVDACLKGKVWIDFGKVTRPLKPEEITVVTDVINVWGNRKILEGAVPLSAANATVAAAVTKTLAKNYTSNAPPERAERVTKLLELAAQDLNPNALRGDARDKRRMQLEATKIGILANAEEEDRRNCECINALPPCPPSPGPAPFLVPVACTKMAPVGDKPARVSEVCVLCCRKQAVTWRSFRYAFGSALEDQFDRLSDVCCHQPAPPSTDFGKWLDDWDDFLEKPYIPKPIPQPEPMPLWPPRKFPDYPPRKPDFGLTQPGLGGRLINPRPDINRLPPALATDVLTGNGYEVVKTLNLDEGDPLLNIKELGGAQGGIIGKATPEPGDKVVMLARDGKAVDYIVIEKGSGRLPFETPTESAAKINDAIANLDFSKIITGQPAPGGVAPSAAPTLPVAELDAFEARLKGLIEIKDATEKDVDRLGTERTRLSSELAELDDSFANLDSRRNAAAGDLDRSKAELVALEREKAASLASIRATKAELDTVKAAHAEFVGSMRREQPIEAVVINNPGALAKLKATGIVSVSDLQSADTRTLTRLLTNTGLTGSKVKTLATTFVRR
jgi:hypothetical protein